MRARAPGVAELIVKMCAHAPGVLELIVKCVRKTLYKTTYETPWVRSYEA